MRRNMDQLRGYVPVELGRQAFAGTVIEKRIIKHNGPVAELYDVGGEFAQEVINVALEDPARKLSTAQLALDELDMRRGAYVMDDPDVYREEISTLYVYRQKLIAQGLMIPHHATTADTVFSLIASTVVEGLASVNQTRAFQQSRSQGINDHDVMQSRRAHLRVRSFERFTFPAA